MSNNQPVWVRGTNSSIFLECYRKNGKWYLMAKGYQFNKGFVPMSETIDCGITDSNGVNWETISGYSFEHIKDSGSYANKTTIFDIDSEIKNLNSIIEYCEDPIRLSYVLLRIKQYLGSNQQIMDLLIKFQNKKEIIVKKINNKLEYFQSFVGIIDEDLSKYPFEKVKEAIEKNHKIINEILKKYNFPQFDYNRFGPYLYFNDKDYIDKTIRCKLRYSGAFSCPISQTQNEIPFKFLVVNFFASDIVEKYNVKEKIRKQCNNHIRNLTYTKNLFEYASDPNQHAKYKIMESDKKILIDLVPIIIASSTIKGEYICGETNIKKKLVIGKNGADIIYVKSDTDAIKINELLAIKKIDDVEIRTNSTIFDN